MATIRTWADFFTQPAGQTVLAWEAAAYGAVVRNKLGDRAIQLGLEPIDTLSASPITHRVLVTDNIVAQGAHDLRVPLVAEEWALPLANECADLVVWPHGFDRNRENFRDVLAEIERILEPNGLLVTTLFNTTGCWCLRSKVLHTRSILPDHAACVPMNTAKLALMESKLAIEGGCFGVYGINPHCYETAKDDRLPTWVDKAGDRWWPSLSNVILLVARKKTHGMTLVGKVAFNKSTAKTAATALAQKHADKPL